MKDPVKWLRMIEILDKTAKVLNGETDICPHCEQTALPLQQKGTSVVGACGCLIANETLQRRPKRKK